MIKGELFEMQPLRFSSRRPGETMVCRVSAAAAAEMLRPKICMTSDAYDAYLQTSSDIKDSKQLALGFNKAYSKMVTTSVVTDPFSTDKNFIDNLTSGVTEGAIKLIRADRTRTCPQHFRALKLVTPGHIAIALWDIAHEKIEVFDAGGSGSNDAYLYLLDNVFNSAKVPIPRVEFVNDEFLQKEDKFCQTYIYFYLQRRALGESSSQIVDGLKKMTPMERFQLMHQVFSKLVHSGGCARCRQAGVARNSRAAKLKPTYHHRRRLVNLPRQSNKYSHD